MAMYNDVEIEDEDNGVDEFEDDYVEGDVPASAAQSNSSASSDLEPMQNTGTTSAPDSDITLEAFVHGRSWAEAGFDKLMYFLLERMNEPTNLTADEYSRKVTELLAGKSVENKVSFMQNYCSADDLAAAPFLALTLPTSENPSKKGRLALRLITRVLHEVKKIGLNSAEAGTEANKLIAEAHQRGITAYEYAYKLLFGSKMGQSTITSEGMASICDKTISALDKYYDLLLDGTFEGIVGRYNGVISAYRIDKTNKIIGLSSERTDYLQRLIKGTSIISGAEDIITDDITTDPPLELIKRWLQGGCKTTYMPAFHLSVLSGVTDKGFSLAYSEHRDIVHHRVKVLFSELEKALKNKGITGVALASWGEKLSSVLMSIVVVQRINIGTMISFAATYKVSELEGLLDKSKQLISLETMPLTDEKSLILLDGEKAAIPSLSVVNLCFNLEKYQSDINFAFKAVEEMALRGKKSDMSNVILGTQADGTRVPINMQDANMFCVPIFGKSGSGKGVMTLATLGTAIATGHPFIYVDHKPDMAAMLWGIENELRSNGINARFLVTDTASICNKEARKTAKHTPERITRNLCKNSDMINQFCAKYEATKPDLESFSTCVVACKMAQLIMLLNTGEFGRSKGGRLVAVIDECDKVARQFTVLETFLSSLKKQMIDFDSRAKSKDKHYQGNEDDYKLLGKILKGLNSTLNSFDKGYTQKTGAGAPTGVITQSLESYLKNNGRTNNAVMLICVGQNRDETIRASSSFPWAICLNSSACTPILGTGNLDAVEQKRFHADKEGSLPVGHFVINHSVLCKSYLTLNENDYYNEPRYVNRSQGAFTGNVVVGKSASWIEENLGTAEKPNEAVGFWGYIKMLARINGLSESQLVENMNLGYDRALQALKDTGIMEKYGYVEIEDWVYDLNPETYYLAGLIESSSDSAINFSSDDIFGSDTLGQSVPIQDIDSQSNNEANAVAMEVPNSFENSDFTKNRLNVDENKPQPLTNGSQPLANGSQPLANGSQPLANPEKQGTPPPQREVNTSYGTQNASDTTKNASAFNVEDSYTDHVDLGNGKECAFAAYHKGKYRYDRIRRDITSKLIDHMARACGGLDGITSFKEQNGMVYLNNKLFAPQVDQSVVLLAPPLIQKELMSGKYFCLLDFSKLKRLRNLTVFEVQDQSIIDDHFWTDTGITPYDGAKLKKKWKRLRKFIVDGKDILEEKDTGTGDKKSSAESKKSDDAVAKTTAKGVGSCIAAALGIPASSANSHPVLQSFGNSRCMRALKKGVGFGLACWGLSAIIAISNPFVLLGSLFTVGAYLQDRKKK